MIIRSKLAICAAARFVRAAAGGCDTDERSSPARADPRGATASVSTDRTACAYVEARPTYLPWLEADEEVPEPQRDVANGTSYVAWTSGRGGPSQSSVILRRSSEPRGGRGEPVSVRLEGARGYYYAAPDSSAGVLWKTDAESCKLITLALSLPGAGRAELRAEILKVVESLES